MYSSSFWLQFWMRQPRASVTSPHLVPPDCFCWLSFHSILQYSLFLKLLIEPGMQKGCDTGPVWAPSLRASAWHVSLGAHPSQVALWVSWRVSSLDKLKAKWDTPAPFLFAFWASPLLHFFPSNVIVRLTVHYFRSFLFSRPFPWLHLAKASLTYPLWHLMFLCRQVKWNTFENSSSHVR